MSVPISKRLLLAAELVRDGAVLGDVGTDHAYLAIHLLECGKIQRAVLSDINRGPLLNAKENVSDSGFSDKVEFRLGDGARELDSLGITDYAICGMGGELIADIIEHAPHLKDGNVSLILNPMTKPEALRRYLFENGFYIEDERYVTDEGKHYVCILARYSGKCTEYTIADAYFGESRFFAHPIYDDMLEYMNEKVITLRRVIRGKELGGVEREDDMFLLNSLIYRLRGK